jgi:hypothetical protein
LRADAGRARQILRLSRIGPLKHAFADFYSPTFAQAAGDDGQYGWSVLVFFLKRGRSIAPRRTRRAVNSVRCGADRWKVAHEIRKVGSGR